MIDVVFEASIADVLDDHIGDQRLKDALFGQGIIGAWAGPKDAGTASVKLMHFQGDLEGLGPLWGYVRGGMGMVSFAIADAAQDAGVDAAQADFERCTRGEAAVGFGEIYVQTGYDPSPAPPGRHLMSVFGQYAPYDFDWTNRREEVAKQFIDLIARFAPDFPDVLEHYEVLGPPDIKARIGLTGGNIFQGETMPDQMWEHRLSARTPVPACTCAARPRTPRAA